MHVDGDRVPVAVPPLLAACVVALLLEPLRPLSVPPPPMSAAS
jgi:hypothetical protein